MSANLTVSTCSKNGKPYIILDNREDKLIKLFEAFKEEFGMDYEVRVEVLDLSDITVKDKDGKDILLIERKTLSDLASSLKDGRYAEQSHRLQNTDLQNHNIIYLIEGDLRNYSNKYTKIPKKTLQTTMFCLNYFKGFSVHRTMDKLETVQFILRLVDKMYRENHKKPYYRNVDVSGNAIRANIASYYQRRRTNSRSPKRYVEVVQKVKKNNLTPENIGEVILAQIPGISGTTSKAIMKNYGSLRELLNKMNEDQHCLDNIKYKTKTGQMRRINKTSVQSIYKFLLRDKKESDVIVVKD